MQTRIKQTFNLALAMVSSILLLQVLFTAPSQAAWTPPAGQIISTLGTVLDNTTTTSQADHACGKKSCMAVQSDGNFVIYKCTLNDRNACWNAYVPGRWQALWATNKLGSGVTGLVNYVSPNLSIFRGSSRIWCTCTATVPKYGTILQDDGNLVIYGSDGLALWAAGTNW